MKGLVVSDLHLTDRAADDYRWALFPQLSGISTNRGLTELFVLGDLTEFKDYHSSVLVNRLISSLYALRRTSKINEIHILKGNHDGLDPDTPYFDFLRRLPWCFFYTRPELVDRGRFRYLFLPHTKDPDTDWKDVDWEAPTHIFFHGTVTGACSETGAKLSGMSLDWFKGSRATILAGDIHQPQKIGPVEYVGAPYPIRYGDEFEPRALVLDWTKRPESVPLQAPRKVTLRVQASGEIVGPVLRKGDFVRVVLSLREAELGQFHDLKSIVSKTAKESGATLQKVQLEKIVEEEPGQPAFKLKSKARSPEDELRAYCRSKSVPKDLVQLGLELLSSD